MMIKLKEIREKIDKVDADVVALLKRRFELALIIKKLGQETETLEKVKKRAEVLGLISPEFIEKIFTATIAESTRLQGKDLLLAGFQGEYGAYSEIASLQYDPSLVVIAFEDFSDIFQNVEHGYLDMGVVPVENTIGGAITQVNELLIDTELKIVGEVKLPIRHCLLTLPGVDYKDIKAVYSHPQAISQCRSFIERNKLEGRPYYDTAGAAKMLGSSIPANSAVIASLRCAQLYGLEIIKEGIEDHKENYTRFVVISKKENAPTVKLLNKTSIIFSLPDRAGTLFEVLKLFSEADMNLTRIESMPRRDLPGSYYFFLDFIGNSYDKKTVNILAEIEKVSTKYNFLGCYKGV